MNTLKKIYCRTVQLAFRAALPFLPYREPRILHGTGELIPLLREKKITSVLLVTDPSLYRMGMTAELEHLLREADIRCTVYHKTCTNPTADNVEEALQLYLEAGCEFLIAFGGGSSMDCAKAVGARIAYPKRPLSRLKGTLRVLRRIPPLAAIPTTAGTGSEVTLTAVITDPRQKHKYTMNSFSLIPRYAVLDPAVTYSLPPKLTATTGMDALTHAVEAYIGGTTNRKTRRWALEATALVFGNIERAYADGRDAEAREHMLHAAYLAGAAFSQSYVGYVHAVAHSLGGQYDIPHGLANAVLLPVVLEGYGEAVYPKLARLAAAAGLADENTPAPAAAKAFIAAVKELNRRMEIPETLPGIREEDIPKMAAHADREANPLYPVPVLMDAAELYPFYRKISASN